MAIKAGVLFFGVMSGITQADVANTPVVGALYNSSRIIQQQIVGGLDNTVTTGRDVALFTVGGLTLDAYILTLPMDVDIKARVIARLSNPVYSIQLGHFIHQFYNQYSGLDNEDLFRQHLLGHYSVAELQRWQHSLFSLHEPASDEPASDERVAEEDPERREGLVINARLIAALVTIYDILFNNDEWLLGQRLPDHYRYLENTPEDQAIIARVQPIVLEVMGDYSDGLEEGEMKAAIQSVIAQGGAEYKDQVNNKAQAITITLIDFVRMNVLKAYRQFALEKHRIDAVGQWMQTTLDDNPQELIGFLEGQNNKRYGVQITVDGLQQGLVQALASDEDSPFLRQAYQRTQDSARFRPASEPVITPEHQPQERFLSQLLVDDGAMARKDPDYLPFFKSLYRNDRNSIARFGLSSTPTISVRNLPIIKTGAAVAGNRSTGIPNFHFVDRELDRAYYFYGNDALQLDRLVKENDMQTMFDRLSYLKTLNCNAQYDWNAQVSYDGLVNLAVGEAVRDFGEQRCLREIRARGAIEPALRDKRRQLIADIQAYQQINQWSPITRWTRKATLKDELLELAELSEQGMPDYVLVYNPWPDHFAHFKGVFSDEIISPSGELNRLDYWLSEMTRVYQDAGIYSDTLWGMAGDHGLAPVYYALNPEQQVLAALQSEYGVVLTIDKISSDEGEGPKITNALNYPGYSDVDVVVASTAGGNFMMDLFNSSRGWKVQPLYSELIDFRVDRVSRQVLVDTASAESGEPATDVTLITPQRSIDLIQEIAGRLRETLDYLVVREADCSLAQCAVRLVAYRDGQRMDEIIKRQGNRLYYSPVGKTPLSGVVGTEANGGVGILLDIKKSNAYVRKLTSTEATEKAHLIAECISNAVPDDPSSWCTEQQWRRLTRFSPRPDSVNQLSHLYDESRAGTINLFPKEGIGFNTIVPGRHAGEHYLEKDAFIGFWGEPANASIRIESVDNGSLAPTIYEYLSGDTVVVGENGWGYPSLLDQVTHSSQ